MYRVFSCLTGEHDWRLVVLAGAICLLASVSINMPAKALKRVGSALRELLGLAEADRPARVGSGPSCRAAMS